MSWSFDAINDYGSTASTLDLGVATVTVSFWLYWDAYASDDDQAMEFGNLAAGGFGFLPNYSAYGGGQFGIYTCNTVAAFDVVTMTRPSAAGWHHYVTTFDLGQSQSIRNCYVDGSSASLTSQDTSNTAATFATTTLYLMSRAGASLFGGGDMAEVAIWRGTILGADQALMLSKGYAPTMIGSKPTHYWPLIGNTTSEYNPTGGVAMSITGATKAAHPRVIYPAPKFNRRFKPAAASTLRQLLLTGVGT